jgi:hypothetical protein
MFITETECVYCAVRTGSLCVLCGSEKTQRLFPYTALTFGFYNRDGMCLLRGTDWFCKIIKVNFCLHIRSVVDKVSLEQSFLRTLRLSPVSIIPPLLHTRISLHAALREELVKSENINTPMPFRKLSTNR